MEQQHHNFQPSHQLISLKNSLRDIDIPPRKLLTRRPTVAGDMFSGKTLLQKYLPHNKPTSDDDSDADADDDPYSSDHFRMFEFKVRRCTRSRSHDWTDCPFAHPGEKARRRDPRRFHYSGTVCPEYRRAGVCSRGDACEYSHGVFECWLHPARYRTQACKDGKLCKRKVCFFAHSTRQLRVLPLSSSSHDVVVSCNNNNNNKNKKSNKFLNPCSGSSNNSCCLFCHCCCCGAGAGAATCSPTSTLFGMSRFSPPMSPSSPNDAVASGSPSFARGGFVGFEKNGVVSHCGVVSYKDVLAELMCSLEGLNFGEASPVSGSKAQNAMPWIDGAFCCEDQQQFVLSPSAADSFGCEEHNQHQQQFILSPTITNSAGSASFSNGRKLFRNEGKVVDDFSVLSCPDPDLGWVNDLLM